ncbi:hypothetical protein [Mycobacterium szulgai]|uniref:hypothetical protein n=1 Tax=Mycobacterium szulgai TaxID=1787 RepID=UPI0021F36C06|nr:hypothetical protein [Mycobacterium szulgai]
MKKTGLGLIAILTLAAGLWWWQQPEGSGASTQSLLGLLADENTTGYAVATEPGAFVFRAIWGRTRNIRVNGGTTPAIWQPLTGGFLAISSPSSAGLWRLH